MSKKHNSALRLAQIARRKAIKKANQQRNDAEYGSRKKSKLKNKKSTVSHPFGRCGNIGCKKCNPNWPA